MEKQRHTDIETQGDDKISSRKIEMEERRREMCVREMWLKNWCL